MKSQEKESNPRPYKTLTHTAYFTQSMKLGVCTYTESFASYMFTDTTYSTYFMKMKENIIKHS